MMQLYGERFARASMLGYVEKIIFFFGGLMEIRHMFLWAIGTPLLLGTILSVATEAGGQKDTGSSSGGKQWLVAMTPITMARSPSKNSLPIYGNPVRQGQR